MQLRTDGDGYPLYRRRKPDYGGHTTTIKINNDNISKLITNGLYATPLFNAHIIMEACKSVKSKYIFKYVNKGSDMAVFGLANLNVPVNEVE